MCLVKFTNIYKMKNINFTSIKDSFKNYSNNIRQNPKKYLTLIGGLFVLFSLGTHPVGSSNAPYYLSYMQAKAPYVKSVPARYAYTTYSSNFYTVTNALTAIISGLLKNKYNFTYKQMHYFGLIFYS
jgi:hypothetical protein